MSTKAQSRLLALREGEEGRSEHDRLERHFRERWMSCRDAGPEETGRHNPAGDLFSGFLTCVGLPGTARVRKNSGSPFVRRCTPQRLCQVE